MNMQHEDYLALQLHLTHQADLLKQTQLKITNLKAKVDNTHLQQASTSLIPTLRPSNTKYRPTPSTKTKSTHSPPSSPSTSTTPPSKGMSEAPI